MIYKRRMRLTGTTKMSNWCLETAFDCDIRLSADMGLEWKAENILVEAHLKRRLALVRS